MPRLPKGQSCTRQARQVSQRVSTTIAVFNSYIKIVVFFMTEVSNPSWQTNVWLQFKD